MDRAATPEGTARYARRFAARCAEGHFRPGQGLVLSSIGLGTYLGEHDEKTDRLYAEALRLSLESGSNVVDTAVNYRFQRSERVIGEVLERMFSAGEPAREEVFVCTKGGYLSFDGAPPRDARAWFEQTFVRPGVARFEDVVAGCHCMTPRYLRHQLETSLRNLRLSTVDLYYLHNPETQLAEVGRDEFARRIRAAFEEMEDRAADGSVRWYGVATWNAFRAKPEAREYVSLAELVAIAREVAGEGHRFRFVQLPFNLAMPEAWTLRNQEVDGTRYSPLEAASRLGLTVVTSAPLLQGRLSRGLPTALARAFSGLETDAQRALQFARSAPGVTTALVGMKRPEHVRENLATARVPPLAPELFRSFFEG
ncbi:MAG: aldo/keto reductase [Candidatus Binatia bacterium]|nr:MAG: aldo/keto reductase [Candidatus Binatia bacterium]